MNRFHVSSGVGGSVSAHTFLQVYTAAASALTVRLEISLSVLEIFTVRRPCTVSSEVVFLVPERP